MAILGGDMLEGFEYDSGYYAGYDAGKEKILSVIDSVVFYNGIGEFVLSWKDKEPDMSGYIRPDYREQGYDVETTTNLEFIWMIAVELYGECGTSPRSGWIEDINGFRKFIEAITETYRKEEGNLF